MNLSKSRADYAFIQHMIETAKDKTGKARVIVPHDVLFRNGAEGCIRKIVIKNLLEAVAGLPENIFFWNQHIRCQTDFQQSKER